MSYARDAFNKFAVTAALTTALLGGVQQSAFANQSGTPVPQRPTAGQTEQAPVKPWAKDPNYLDKIRTYELAEASRLRTYHELEQQELNEAKRNYTAQTAFMTPEKMPDPGARLSALATAGRQSVNKNAQIETKWTQVMAAEFAMQAKYVRDLDKTFGDMPQYKGKSAPAGQQRVAAKPTKPT